MGLHVQCVRPKQVLIRAVGPTLSSFGVPGSLAAARLEIFSGATFDCRRHRLGQSEMTNPQRRATDKEDWDSLQSAMRQPTQWAIAGRET
jgi:hypothetical protein